MFPRWAVLHLRLRRRETGCDDCPSAFGVWAQGQERKIERLKPSFEAKATADIFMIRDQIILLFGQPSRVDVYHPDLVPLKLLNFIGFHSLGSRIYQLREQSGLFYGASGAWAVSASKEPGFDYLGTILTPDTVEKAEHQIHELVSKMAEKGVTEQELDAARQASLKNLIDLVASNGAVASLLTRIEDLDLGYDYYDKKLKRVQNITRDEVNKVCTKYFNTKNMARVKVGRV